MRWYPLAGIYQSTTAALGFAVSFIFLRQEDAQDNDTLKQCRSESAVADNPTSTLAWLRLICRQSGAPLVVWEPCVGALFPAVAIAINLTRSMIFFKVTRATNSSRNAEKEAPRVK